MRRVRFLPQDLIVTAASGDTIMDTALDNGVDLPHECGGNCACTTCHVLVDAQYGELTLMEEVEQDRLISAEGLERRSRLACQAIFLNSDAASEPELESETLITVSVVGVTD